MYIIEKFTVIGQMHGWLDCQTFLLINQAKFVKTEFKFFREIIKNFSFLFFTMHFFILAILCNVTEGPLYFG